MSAASAAATASAAVSAAVAVAAVAAAALRGGPGVRPNAPPLCPLLSAAPHSLQRAKEAVAQCKAATTSFTFQAPGRASPCFTFKFGQAAEKAQAQEEPEAQYERWGPSAGREHARTPPDVIARLGACTLRCAMSHEPIGCGSARTGSGAQWDACLGGGAVVVAP